MTSYLDGVVRAEWQHATTAEIDAPARIGTRDLISLRPRAHLITYKWVYKVKPLMVLLSITKLV